MAFVAQRVGMEFIGPFLFTGIRMSLGALVLLIALPLVRLFAARTGAERAASAFRPSLFRAGGICGVAIFFASCFQQIGLVSTTASKAGFLTALYIVLVPILGIALRHKTHWNTWLSALIAALGLYFLCIQEGFSVRAGDVITLVGALFWAVHILVIDHFVKGLGRGDVMRLCIVQFAVAALLSLAAAPFLDSMFVAESFSPENLAGALPTLLYAGILSTGVAFTLQAVGQQGLNPAAASIVMSLEAAFSVLGGVLILGEVLSGREIFGCVAMFAAVILSQAPIAQSTAQSEKGT
jgi:drug/metabolite transporter (DMT)-like permease